MKEGFMHNIQPHAMNQIENHPQASSKPQSKPQGAPGEMRFQRNLSVNKRLTVCIWNGEVRIDVRAWENFPTKKGLSLTLPRWKTLLTYEDELTTALGQARCGQLNNKVQHHLGGGQFATVSPVSPTLDLRQYFMPDDLMKQILPTKKGVVLTRDEWDNLISCIQEINEAVPELESTQICSEKPDHYFHLESLKCGECNPFTALEKSLLKDVTPC